MNLSAIKRELDKKYEMWSIRKISKLSAKNNKPSLTITKELEELGLNPDDLVVVAISEGKIIIERL